MNTIIRHLESHKGVSAYKINQSRKESYQLFFVKGDLEMVRNTDNLDRQVTVYADHGDCRGHASFFVYASTTEEELDKLIDEAAEQALLIDNPAYTLPAAEEGHYSVDTDLDRMDASELCAVIANTVFAANTLAVTSLNAVEVFLRRITETVVNSNGLHKSQVRWTAMVEAIPTATEGGESVELYEQVNFSRLDVNALRERIADCLAQAKARHDAKRLSVTGVDRVVLNSQELMELFWNFAGDLDYSSIYSHHNVFHKGDLLQTAPNGDKLGITMAGSIPGCANSTMFDGDGLTVTECRIVEDGKVVSYHGSNRFGQYLGETPTGVLNCLRLDPGSADEAELTKGSWLEVVSMSGIQTDFYTDYVGGEIRLAYWHDGETVRPVTGVSISGKLSDFLNNIRFSRDCALYGSYYGPKKALITGMTIF